VILSSNRPFPDCINLSGIVRDLSDHLGQPLLPVARRNVNKHVNLYRLSQQFPDIIRLDKPMGQIFDICLA